MSCQIFPSLLSADVMHLEDEIASVVAASADMLHIDVMDNHYVPNITFGPSLCKAIHDRFPTLPLDVHLMVTPVDEMIRAFATAGATRISIHPDATIHLDRSLQLIQEMGCQVGLVLNPATPLDSLTWSAHRLDFILIMTVNPGFGGQMLIPEIIQKIEQTHRHYPKIPICVDGGVTIDNMAALTRAGASEFVAGSTIFHSDDYVKTISKLRAASALRPPLTNNTHE